MSELPTTGIDSRQLFAEESDMYKHYFGLINRQASINSVAAYVGDSLEQKPNDRDIATAWLLNDSQAMEALIPVENRSAKLHAALMRASTEMWAHFHMQKYKDQRPDRLTGLNQAEIPTV